ncbi:hypothetical protein GGR42_000257 [Saonia flava]|uniref:Adhesin domain-containing protein n=1 Tax=Saonia flava TaxID=523696 RepID=A0A846QW44_9FLAO|nr:hypothetical protein [Saonia flava]NJB69795.1 hypothetical protein [Saonia flava]
MIRSISFGQETVSKKIEKSYGLTNSGELHLNNKYGDVIINGWDRSSVRLTIDVEVTHKKKENAKDLLDRIDVTTKVTKDLVDLTTEIHQGSSGFFARYFSKVNPFDLDKSNIKINYTIYLPNNAEMNITNKFGDVIISDWQGKLKTNIEHGDFWINDDLTNAHINITFGKLNAKTITYGNITIKNGELDLEGSKQLQLTSSGTTMEIGAISSLEIESSKDEINIDEVKSIHGDLDFTKIHINTLGEEIDIKTKVADFWVSAITKPDSKIYIDQESSEFNISISGQSLIFNATLEQGLLRIPKSFTDIHTDIINNSRKIRKINATYGKGPYGEFVLTGLKGVIILKEN